MLELLAATPVLAMLQHAETGVMDIFNEEPVWLVALAGILLGAIAVLANAAVRIYQHHADTSLKQTMVENGMSADDIERILSMPSSKERIATAAIKAHATSRV